MAPRTKVPYALPLFALLLLSMVFVGLAIDDTSILRGGKQELIDCGSACGYRCSKASRAKICLKDCMACCRTCNCVPPGTAGNREACPCYNNIKNSKGTGKCP